MIRSSIGWGAEDCSKVWPAPAPDSAVAAVSSSSKKPRGSNNLTLLGELKNMSTMPQTAVYAYREHDTKINADHVWAQYAPAEMTTQAVAHLEPEERIIILLGNFLVHGEAVNVRRRSEELLPRTPVQVFLKCPVRFRERHQREAEFCQLCDGDRRRFCEPLLEELLNIRLELRSDRCAGGRARAGASTSQSPSSSVRCSAVRLSEAKRTGKHSAAAREKDSR